MAPRTSPYPRHRAPTCGRSSVRDDRGGAVIEFAFVVPLFLVMLFGTIQYSLYFLSAQSGSSSARETARRAAVGDLSCAQLTTVAREHVEMVAGGFTVTRRYYAPTYTTITATTPTRTTPQVGDNVVVRVQYRTHDLRMPMVPVPSSGGVRLQVVETATARVESITPNTRPCG